MNSDHPSDYSPLSYGAGLTIGLLLILGLPSASTSGPKTVELPRPEPLSAAR